MVLPFHNRCLAGDTRIVRNLCDGLRRNVDNCLLKTLALTSRAPDSV